MASRENSVYLNHIRDCCIEIEECRKVRKLSEAIVLSAVCRNIEIIGEAANKISSEYRDAHPEIPWRQMISARNLLIHNYDGVDAEIVWGIVAQQIPALLVAVDRLLVQKSMS